MPPDINTLSSTSPQDIATSTTATTSSHRIISPPSSTTTSRRTSMLPPAHPASTSLSTSQPQPSSALPHRSPIIAPNDGFSTSGGMGIPLRHPRPLTAAELYLECEKEQEAVVNRLTRELTALRAQSASVASNASISSTSTGISQQSLLPIDISDPNPAHQMTGPTHPTPSRRPRSSSSVSGRSLHASVSMVSMQQQPSSRETISQHQSQQQHQQQIQPPNQPSSIYYPQDQRANLSRQTSYSALSSTGASTPARYSLDVSRLVAAAQQQPSSSSSAVSTNDPRAELDLVRAENETLRQRVRALERALRSAQQVTVAQQQQLAGGGPIPSSCTSSSMSAAMQTSQQLQQRRPRSRRDSSLSDAGASSGSGGESGGGGVVPGLSTTTTTTTSYWTEDRGIGGVAGPRERERSESMSTTASRGELRRGGGGGSGGGLSAAVVPSPGVSSTGVGMGGSAAGSAVSLAGSLSAGAGEERGRGGGSGNHASASTAD